MRSIDLPADVNTDIEVRQITLDLVAPIPADIWHDLDETERARAAAYLFHADRVRFAVTRGALKRLLARHLDQPVLELRIGVGRHGKPYLLDAPQLPFNVSHAGNFCLVAIGRTGHLGVDIELVQMQSVEPGMLEQVLTQSERSMVEAEPTRFFSFWTAKEALLKALGPGMSMPPTSLDIAPGLGGSIRLASAPQGVSARQPRVWPLVAPSGYAAALAWVGAA